MYITSSFHRFNLRRLKEKCFFHEHFLDSALIVDFTVGCSGFFIRNVFIKKLGCVLPDGVPDFFNLFLFTYILYHAMRVFSRGFCKKNKKIMKKMTRLPARGRTGAKLKENEFADGLRSVRFSFYTDFNGCICCKRMPDAARMPERRAEEDQPEKTGRSRVKAGEHTVRLNRMRYIIDV